ncbi:unnamed protein product, partial [Mesorhabditis belari]|uniref:PAS domain-containing protein n=1 Tax=Mesorhabditis belari TaxID=2138241 RepID=A0AAF3FN01_9BILA
MAQQRRLLENREFENLARGLPLSRTIAAEHIDKSTMVKLALSFIKLHQVIDFDKVKRYCYRNPTNFPLDSSEMLDILDGFLLVLSESGDVLYISETVSVFMGLSQVEMSGTAFRLYIHPEDFVLYQWAFTTSKDDGQPIAFNLRIMSSLTKRANRETAKASPGFKVVRLELRCTNGCTLLYITPLPQLVLSTVTLPSYSMCIILNLDFTINTINPKLEELLLSPYFPQEISLKGESLYKLIHIDDVEIVKRAHFDAFYLRSHRTSYFRLIQRGTGLDTNVQATAFRYTSQTLRNNTDSITMIILIL